MYDKVYTDLMISDKGMALDKTALSMNVHNEELQEFLTKQIDTPSLLFGAEEKVFKTEPMHHSNDHSLNYCLTKLHSCSYITCFIWSPMIAGCYIQWCK